MSLGIKFMGKGPEGEAIGVNADSLGNILFNTANNFDLAINQAVNAGSIYTTKPITVSASELKVYMKWDVDTQPNNYHVDIEFLSASGVSLEIKQDVFMSDKTTDSFEYTVPVGSRVRFIIRNNHTSNRTLLLFNVIMSSYVDIANRIRGRNVRLGYASGVKILSRGRLDLTTNLFNIDKMLEDIIAETSLFNLEDFLFVYIVVRTGADHNFKVSLVYRHPNDGSFGTSTGPSHLFSFADNSEPTRKASEWLSLQSDSCILRIVNESSDTQTYDVVLYGVR